MAVVVPQLPNLGSAAEIDSFYADHAGAMKLILFSVSIGFVFFLFFLSAVVEHLRAIRSAGAWTWVAFSSALMFMTALNVALGLDAAAVLLHERAEPEVVWALHSGAFLLAAPAAAAGIAFFVAVAAVTLSGEALPRVSGWWAVVAVVINAGALGGFFSLTGALNAGNGLIGGLAGPILAWLVWIVAVSVAWLIQGNEVDKRLPSRARASAQ